MSGVGKGRGTLRAAMPESFRGSMQTVAIGHRADAITIGIDDKAEAKIECVKKGVIVKPGAVAGGEILNALRPQNLLSIERMAPPRLG